MKKLRPYSFVFIFLSLFISLYSQNENKKWYFGLQTGLDFMTIPPVPLTNGTLVTSWGSASVADANGNLLFYTTGDTVFNQNHTVMANGGIGNGNCSSIQSALIAKLPGSTSQYFVFAINTPSLNIISLNYSVVDMSLAAGLGSVTVKNIVLTTNTSQKLTATKHCNGNDIWIVCHDTTNKFYAYLLNSLGVNMSPVVSVTGTTYSVFPELGIQGQMKISPNGRKLATAIYNTSTLSNNSFEIFDFDNSTGIVSNPQVLLSGYRQAYGCEFSADGSKLYGSKQIHNQPSIPSIYQWDLCAGSPTAIVASQSSVTTSTSTLVSLGAMQLAPDGKIYVSRFNQQFLGVINSPNLNANVCNYVDQGQAVGSKTLQFGLPNFMSSTLLQHISPGPFTYSLNPNLGCQAVQFTAPPALQNSTFTPCASAGYSLLAKQWDFGDPASGATNTSTLTNPTHTFSQLGTYTTQLILYYSCGGGTDTIRQTVQVNQLCISLSSQSITCSSLGSATVHLANGIGPFSYTWQPGNQTTQVATGLAPGTYTIMVHDTGSGVSSQTTTTFTSLIPLSGNLSNSSSITCHGANTGTAAYTNIAGGSANQTYFWSNGLTTYTSTSPSYTNLSAGGWTSQVTDALTSCQIYSVFTITEPPPITLSLSASSPTTCANASISLSSTVAGGSGGYTYTWSNGSQTQQASLTETTAGSYVYTLTAADLYSCIATNTLQVNVIPLPTLSVSDVSICTQQAGTLQVSGASTYTWNGVSSGASFIASPGSTTQYSVVGTAQSCTALATASIVVEPVPFISIAASSPLCEGENLLLAAYGGTSYAWSGPANFSSTLQAPQVTSSTLLNGGVYQVSITAANGCTASTQGTVQINAIPSVTVSPLNILCATQTLSLSASSLPGASYLWKGPQSFSSSLQYPTVSGFSQTGLMNYTVSVTSPQNCSNTAVASASIIPAPSLSVSLSSPSLCAQALSGSPNSITLTSGGANTYTLVTPLHITSTSPSGPIVPISTQPPYSTGVASATLYGSNGVCTVSTTANFNVIPNPSLTVLSNTPVICAGESFTYTSFGAASYTWGPNSPNLTTYSVGEVAVVNPSINSVFSVVGGSLGCYSAVKELSLTVYALPQITLTPFSPSICLKSSTILQANGTGTSYTWAPSLGLSGIFGSSVLASPQNDQQYTLTASANNCTSSAVITVSVLPLPSPQITLNKTAVCLNEEIVFTGSGGQSYTWNGPYLVNRQENPLVIKADHTFKAGTYTLTVSDEKGCQASSTAAFSIYDLPDGSLKGTMQACVPFESEYSFVKNSHASDAIQVYWLRGSQQINNKKFSYRFDTPGTYTFTGFYQDTLTTCKNTENFIITALPKPKADFQTEPAKPRANLEEVLFVNTSQGQALNKYRWYFFNNSGYESQQKNTAYLFTDPGKYLIVLEVENGYGCKDTVIKTIQIEEDFSMYVPNAFTPNGDGTNDVFLPVIRAVKAYELRIFDRWGRQLFQSSDPNQGWDGTKAGQDCKQDSYVWKIHLSTQSGLEKEAEGFVLLTR